MHIGFCRMELYLPDSHSLKGRRQVARSVAARVRNQFNVAVAEVDDGDMWQRLTLGICCLSSDLGHVEQTISRVADFIEGSRPDIQLLDYQIEMISGV